MGAFFRRLLALLRRNRLERDLDDELAFHLAMRQEEYRQSDVPVEQARGTARRQFGNATLLKEQTRDAWGFAWLESVLQDVRFAVRTLRRSPGFTSAAVCTLALALGANTAIFSAVHGTLLHPLAARDPDRLVVVWQTDTSRSLPVVELSYQTVQDWATHSRSFSHSGAFSSSAWTTVLRGAPEPMRLSSTAVSATFFETLDAMPMLGRTFRPADDVPNAERVVVLSYRLWLTRFGGDPSVVGITLQLDQPHVVIGVMPERFDFPRGTDYWTPVVPILAESAATWKINALSDVGVLFFVGRLRDGVSAEAAAEELNTLEEQLQEAGSRRFGTAVTVISVIDFLLGPVRPALWGLFVAAVILLVIGCANVSGLIMKRASLRRREFALRAGLGATLARLSRLWLLETAVLAAVGGSLGLLMAHWMLRAIMTLAPSAIPSLTASSINLPVAVFTLLAVVAAAFVCGVWPSVDMRSLDLNDALKNAPRGISSRGSHRMRSALVTVQIGLAVVLLVAGGLAVRSVVNVGRVDLGFTPSGVLTLQVSARPGALTTNEWIARVVERVAGLPEVEAAGAIAQLPFTLGPIGADSWVLLEGQTDTAETRRQNPTVNYQAAFPGFFRAMRIALQRGRLFTVEDHARSPRVALVSESAARRLWPGQDPLQRRILLPSHTPGGPPTAWRTVVGVVADVRYRGINDPRLDVYDAALQSGLTANHLVVRSTGDLMTLAAAVRAHVRRLDAEAVVDGIATMEEIVARATVPWRFSLWVFTMFAALACVLAAAGLFALVALEVAQRQREFALRLAIGAHPAELQQLALRGAGMSAALGVTGGLLLSLIGTRVIQGMLFQVSALDVGTYVAVVSVIIMIVCLASYVPARRATRVDPIIALRCE